AKALGKIGPGAKAAAAALRGAVKDQDVSVRMEAALALWHVEARADNLDVFLNAAGDPSALVRADACRALGAIGPAAKPAISTLAKLLVDKESAVRGQAAEALGKIGAHECGWIAGSVQKYEEIVGACLNVP